MTIQFHKKFISAIAAISILITGVSASQAEAGQYDAERAIAAILGLAVIGAIIAEDRKDDRRDNAVTRHTPQIQARPLPRDVKRKASRRALPQKCLRSVETRRGSARYFGLRCMEKTFRHVGRLPQACERRIRTDRGVRYGWGARCLRQNGYTIARR